MTKDLPEFARSEVSEHETVVFWTRRAPYEMVEEFSQGLFFIVWYIAGLVMAAVALDWPGLLAALVLVGWPMWYMISEHLNWEYEIYVVTEYTQDKGGVLYQIVGPWDVKSKAIPINAAFSGLTTHEPLRYRLWGWVTGEHMERVTLSAGPNVVINGSRMPPELRKAINLVKGSPATAGANDNPDTIKASQEIRRMGLERHFPQWRIQNMLDRLWNKYLEEHGV